MALLIPEGVRPRKKLCHIHIKHDDAENRIISALAQRFEKVTLTLRRFLHDFRVLAGLLTFNIGCEIANAFGIDGTHQNIMSYTYQLRASCSRRQIESISRISHTHPYTSMKTFIPMTFASIHFLQMRSKRVGCAQMSPHPQFDYAGDDGHVEIDLSARFRTHTPLVYVRD